MKHGPRNEKLLVRAAGLAVHRGRATVVAHDALLMQFWRKPVPYVAGRLAVTTRARAHKSFDTDGLAACVARPWTAAQLQRQTSQ